tara:strand:+ start:7674 stop:7916 length:243 start_codon:yes stop_codon:yes gene_type:complete
VTIPVAQRRQVIIDLMLEPIKELPQIQEVCGGSQFCSCHLPQKKRLLGGTLVSQYKRGIHTPETRAANAKYMREYRKRGK